ncbi:MAG: hypothetical protein COA42_18140, partial [Alteromonadaceae bacterium]
MSFLANLRQKQQDTERALSLYYLLSIDVSTRLAQLKLVLSDSDITHAQLPGKPYFIQRQHIERPPEFIASADIEILSGLIDADGAWLQNHQGLLAGEDLLSTLRQVLASKRCYMQCV